MQPRAEAKAPPLANLGNPGRSAAERMLVNSLRHEQHVGRLPTGHGGENGVDLPQIRFICHDKLQLKIGAAAMNCWMTGTLSRCFSCAAANRPASRCHGVELASFGDIDARSSVRC